MVASRPYCVMKPFGSTPTDGFRVRRGALESERTAIAEVYWHAFAQKVERFVGSRDAGLSIIAEAFRLDRTIVATRGGTVMGVAGLDYDGVSFLRPRFVTCRRLLGLWRGIAAYAGLRFFHGGKSAGQLRIDSLAVAPGERGSGVGRLLLHEVFALARERGFTSVILEVVDSNPRARNLYELLGFRAVAFYRYPWLTRRQGFTGHAVMVKELAEREGGCSSRRAISS